MSVKRTRVNALHLESVLSDLSSKKIEVGFFETSHYPDGTPVAYVAAIQEFGNPSNNLPARPFFRPATVDKQPELSAMMVSAVRSIIGGADVESTLSKVGMSVSGGIQEAIINVSAPPLSSSTIWNRQNRTDKQRNMNDKPLIDTGLMLASVSSQVVSK